MRIPVMQPAPALEGEERADAAQVAVPGGSAAEDPRAASEPPVIEAAIELVAKDPADPEAHLQLALTYWDSGQPPRAAEELAQTASRTGASDRDFLMKAANQFRARGVWSATAAIFLSLIETYPANQTPPEMVEAFHETVYRAAQARELPLFLPFERIDRVDQPLGFIARGRHALYHGTLEDAWLNLDQAQRLRPGLFTVALLEAEIGSGQGYPERHRAILTSLSSDPGAPAWIRTMAGSRLRAMP